MAQRARRDGLSAQGVQDQAHTQSLSLDGRTQKEVLDLHSDQRDYLVSKDDRHHLSPGC